MEAIAGILFLATFIEGLITYIFGESSENPSPNGRPWIRYVSLVLGVAGAIAYQIDIPAMVGLVSGYSLVGYIVSGLVIGRGSNYANDILTSIRGKAN